MEKSFNLKVLESKEQILKVINESQLPATVIHLILKEMLQDVTIQSQQIVKRELEEYNKSLEEEK